MNVLFPVINKAQGNLGSLLTSGIDKLAGIS